jgi:threonine/homoserine/homoserine lactone efflux protein
MAYPGILIQGIIIGFSVAAPIGPIGVLCIRRTLAEGRVLGLVSGLGAASADGIYGLIAAFGLTAISDILIDQQHLLRLVGGVFLVVLGVRTLLTKPAEDAARIEQRSGLIGAFLSTFLLTLTNPLTILAFLAIFAGLGAGDEGGSSGPFGTRTGRFQWIGVVVADSQWRGKPVARAL